MWGPFCALLDVQQYPSLYALDASNMPPSQLGTSLVVQTVKHLPTMQETQVQFLRWEGLLEKEMATHSSILAWRIPWTEEPTVGYSPWGRKGWDTTERLHFFFFTFYLPTCDNETHFHTLTNIPSEVKISPPAKNHWAKGFQKNHKTSSHRTN